MNLFTRSEIFLTYLHKMHTIRKLSKRAFLLSFFFFFFDYMHEGVMGKNLKLEVQVPLNYAT